VPFTADYLKEREAPIPLRERTTMGLNTEAEIASHQARLTERHSKLESQLRQLARWSRGAIVVFVVSIMAILAMPGSSKAEAGSSSPSGVDTALLYIWLLSFAAWLSIRLFRNSARRKLVATGRELTVARAAAELGTGFWLDVQYLAGAGTPLTTGMEVSVGVLDRGFVVSRPGTYIAIPYERVLQIGAGGRGAYQTGGGFVGGGFGLQGAAEGMGAAAALNALTTRTKVETVISVVYGDGELHFLSRTVTPQVLELELSGARSAIRRAQQASTHVPQAATPDLAGQVRELAALKDRGLLDAPEFAALKAKLLA
jgi:hypothetical protein